MDNSIVLLSFLSFLWRSSSIVANNLFRAAHSNDLELLERVCEGLADLSLLEQRTPAGDTAFHLAVLHDNVSVALALLDKRPSLLNMVYEGKLYQGEMKTDRTETC